MTKFARIVFEEEIPDNATPEQAMRAVLLGIKNWWGSQPSEEDVEISDTQYEKGE